VALRRTVHRLRCRGLLIPELFFTGTTQAGRELRLFYEHVAFLAYTDETGEPEHNPTETEITATLDGAPITVESVNWSGESATVRSDLGTFTATSSDYAEDHSEALRRYLEHRPSGGWEVAVVDKSEEDDGLRYTVSITNGRLTERADFVLSKQVATTLARGGPLPPTDEMVARQVAQAVRSDDWAAIKRRADEPTTIMWIAHPA
jgi:hypothetical protein